MDGQFADGIAGEKFEQRGPLFNGIVADACLYGNGAGRGGKDFVQKGGENAGIGDMVVP